MGLCRKRIRSFAGVHLFSQCNLGRTPRFGACGKFALGRGTLLALCFELRFLLHVYAREVFRFGLGAGSHRCLRFGLCLSGTSGLCCRCRLGLGALTPLGFGFQSRLGVNAQPGGGRKFLIRFQTPPRFVRQQCFGFGPGPRSLFRTLFRLKPRLGKPAFTSLGLGRFPRQ